MTKRLSSKLLAVILTLAICATTVFGCLMTVSAADEASSLTFSAGISTDEALLKAKIPLTITLGNEDGFIIEEGFGGITAGQVALSYGDNLTLTGVTATGGTKVDGTTTLATDVASEKVSNGFIFNAANDNTVYYSVLTFELSFDLASPAQNGDTFTVTATSASIASPYDVQIDVNGASGKIVMGCDHKIEPVGEPIITDTVNGYAVYNDSKCTGKCKAQFGKQVVPTKLPGKIDVLAYYPSVDAAAAAGSTDRYVDTKLADNDETGEDWEHAIIIDSALELSYLTRYAGDDTKGKYYKVADGIKGFDMSGGKTNRDGTLEENLDAIITSGKRHDAGETYFQGHFDGNGATVYGLLSNVDNTRAAGLFAYAKGDVEIKNINVSLSYLKAKYHAGGIVGAYSFDTAIGLNDGNKLIIEKCSVTESHIETTAEDAYGYAGTGGIIAGTGAIYGGARCYSGSWDGEVKVSNCFINLDESHFVSLGETDATVNSIHGGIGGVAVSQKATFDNCVVIGIAPYSVYNTEYTPSSDSHQHTFLRGRFSNIYTTAAVTGVTSGGVSNNGKNQDYTGVMYQISANQIKGADAETNMPKLAWGSVWEIDVNRGYPNFVQAKTNNVNETSDFELTLIGTNITYNNGGDYNFNFYYRPKATYTSKDVSLYVAQLNEDNTTLGSFHHLTGEELSADAAAAVDKDKLQEGDIRFTIKRLSAREIYNTLLATAVAVKDGKALWGDTDEFSIADYEQKIIDGNYETADKNLAQAVLKYGRASKAALNTKNDTAGTTLYWDGTTDGNLTDEVHDYSTQTGNAANPIIIDTAAELAYIVQAPYTETQGKYYKIADGISNIVLQKKEHDNGIMQLSSQSEVEAYFENSENSKTRWETKYNYDDYRALAFYGNFDGNGATVYGLYGVNGADSLFGAVMATAVIKNLTVKNCYISGVNYGAVISSAVMPIADTSEEKNTNKYITFENIEISNCRMEVTNVGNKNIGLLTGSHYSGANVTVNNLLVYGCEMFNTTDNTVCTRLSGQTGWNNAATGIKNSVILDCSITDPHNMTLTDGTGRAVYNYVNSAHTIENVYSSCADDATRAAIFSKKITYITNEQAMGVAAITNMPGLDWTNTWCYGDTYPSLAKGTYSTSSSEGKTLYWNGKAASKFYQDTDGASADNPIIINTAEELAYVATATYANTNGKYFKIADGIDKIVLQSETYGDDIIALDSATAVKDYFEDKVAKDISNNKATLHGWASYTWKPANYCFSGNLDGNGVEIYGMYHSTTDINSTINRSLHGGASGGGLFSVADGATISNLAIKNSYAKLGQAGNTHTNYSFGLIVAFGADGDNEPDVNVIDNCTLANNYVYKQVGDNTLGRAGLVCGAGNADISGNSTSFIMQNLLVYGNIATGYMTGSAVDYKLGLAGGNLSGNPLATDAYKTAHPDHVVDDKYMSTVLENSVVLGTPLLPTDTAGTTIKYSQWLVLNALNTSNINYKNVYTDWDVTKINDAGNFKKDIFLANCGEVVTESDLIGNTAKANEIVSKFNASNGKTVWYTGNEVLLGFDKPTEMLPEAQKAYDAITFTSADRDNYGYSDLQFGIYATSLNLKTNPYISFAFAFNGDYKRDRENISVSFKYTVDGKKIDHIFGYTGDTPITSMSVPAYEQGKALNQDGWENSASAGRYHIYRFEDIPVEALSNPIEVTVSYAGGLAGDAKTVTGSFSAKGLALELINSYKQTPCTYYETRIEAVKALLFYTQMLQARYPAQA